MANSTLTGEQVTQTYERAKFDDENQFTFADRMGCSRAQLQRYMREGLPERMNKQVRSNLLRAASEQGVIDTDESIACVII